jgi:hypothetical protein
MEFNNGFLYIIQEREFLKENKPIFKIGKTKQEPEKRFCGYPKNSKIIMLLDVDNVDNKEQIAINYFKEKFNQRTDIGTEYFEGNKFEMEKALFYVARNEDIGGEKYLSALDEINKLVVSKIDEKINKLKTTHEKTMEKVENDKKKYMEMLKKKEEILKKKEEMDKKKKFMDKIKEIKPKLVCILRKKIDIIKDFMASSSIHEDSWIKTGAFHKISLEEYLNDIYCIEFINERIRKTKDSKSKPIKKTSLLAEFHLWLQSTYDFKKFPKNNGLLCEIMNKKFGNFNDKFKGWYGIEFIRDDEDDEDDKLP